ncbi:putative RNA-binding Zn ribbon-like protein [Kribbella aluminosa]|uniref:RNA-binding Zn ribbon-like protein n=1 Tax=Kribbella aluminosa TaxID=416017 RepID=A0ABS4USF6_9ACTN|nr:CGNR zinc finger domain-containing protein [Kribbella aluminosa]MBP2354558.1 putative RNA-binding Zn ribbon-like protein [Kribbella aluminosa]
MEATDHLNDSLTAAIALANTFGSAMRQGRPARAADAASVDAVLRLTTKRPPAVDPSDYAAGAKTLYDALSTLPDVDAAAALVNLLLQQTKAAPQLTRDVGEPWHLHFGNPEAAAGWLAEFATAVAMLLGSDELERVRRCAAARCDDLFLDSTRNRTQRFCSTACQNRTKVAAHRAKAST